MSGRRQTHCEPRPPSLVSCMAVVKICKANKTGHEIAVVFVNFDQIVTVGAGQNMAECQKADGRTRWVHNPFALAELSP